MQDNRTILNQHDEIEEKLLGLSDTDIMIEFSKLLSSSYPHLVKVAAHCYDLFDDFAEALYYNFVYSTFSSKYGAIIDRKETHRYGFSLHCYRKIHHVEVRPKSYPLTVESSDGEAVAFTNYQLGDKKLIFISFGDKKNNLSGDCDDVNIETVDFNFTEVALVDTKSGLYFRNATHYWISNELIDFELVLEDYSQKEHNNFKTKYAD